MAGSTNQAPAGSRPIESYEFHVAAREDHWTATVTPTDRVIGRGNPGLVELVDGQWVPVCSEGGFKWDSLVAGSDGRILAAADGEIGFYAPDAKGQFHYHSLSHLLPERDRGIKNVFDLLEDSHGKMVFVGAGTVVRTDETRAEVCHAPSVRRMNAWIDEGRILIGASGGRVFQLDDKGLNEIATPLAGKIKGLFWSEGIGKSNWIGVCENGIVSGAPGAAERFERVNEWLQRSSPTSFTKMPDGRLAVPTYLNGLFLVDLETGDFTQVGEAQGLLSTYVPKVCVAEGDWVWVVTTRGVNRLSVSNAISFVPNADGFDGAKLLYADMADGNALVSARGGSFEFVDVDGVLQPKRTSDNYFVSHTKVGSLHLGGTLFGVYEFDAKSRQKLVNENADVTAIVSSAFDRDLVYYSADNALRALRIRDGNYQILATEPMPEKVESIVEDRDGDLWVAGGSEVTRVSFSAKQDRFVVRETLRIAGDMSVMTASTKLFLLGSEVFLTRGGSLFAKAGGGTFQDVPSFHAAVIVDAASTSDQEAWALVRPRNHDGALLRLVRLSLNEGALVAGEVSAEGLLAEGQLQNVHSVDAGDGKREIWVGTDEGVLRIYPQRVKVVAGRPALETSVARIEDGRPVPMKAESVTLSHGQGSVSLSWSEPGAARSHQFVETRLVGANEHWVAAGDTTSREFSGLGDGSYAFEVRTVDALGNPGAVSTASFVVLPPWYRTPGALSGFLITALVFGWASWQYKSRIARRRAAQLELLVEDRTRELEHVNAEKTRFIARMNHEIRNPLNGLLGAVGVLEQFAHSEREGRMINILRTCADHLSAVVEDVLDFSNIEGGRIVVQDRAFSVASMIEAVPRMMLAEAERTGTEVVTEIAPEVPGVVVADPDRIRQILVNFLGNALKYAPGEPVHVEVTTVSVENEPWLRFAVRDHGPGISEADKRMLFSMFERGKGAAKQNVRGMGIGLATCRLLARRMGGEVGVISGLGEGSEFFLRLPLKVDAGSESGSQVPEAELHKLSCLLVEDQEFNRVILKDMLERFGCTVDEADCAESALTLAAANRYDVVFTDLELPDAAPGEILEQLMAQQPESDCARPALVVTTAYATENVRQTCLAAGAVAFLPKPLSQNKVLVVLRAIDSSRRPAVPVSLPAVETPGSSSKGAMENLARIRGCGIEAVAAEISQNIDLEVRKLVSSATNSNVRDVAQQAHRLLSLTSLANAPDLAAIAVSIQNNAREGRLPGPGELSALSNCTAGVKGRLASLTSSGAVDGQSRVRGHSGPAV